MRDIHSKLIFEAYVQNLNEASPVVTSTAKRILPRASKDAISSGKRAFQNIHVLHKSYSGLKKAFENLKSLEQQFENIANDAEAATARSTMSKISKRLEEAAAELPSIQETVEVLRNIGKGEMADAVERYSVAKKAIDNYKLGDKWENNKVLPYDLWTPYVRESQVLRGLVDDAVKDKNLGEDAKRYFSDLLKSYKQNDAAFRKHDRENKPFKQFKNWGKGLGEEYGLQTIGYLSIAAIAGLGILYANAKLNGSKVPNPNPEDKSKSGSANTSPGSSVPPPPAAATPTPEPRSTPLPKPTPIQLKPVGGQTKP